MKKPYYFFSSGRLKRKQNTLFLVKSDGEKTYGYRQEDQGEPTGELTDEKIPIPVEQVESIYCFGEIDVNRKLVTYLAQNHIPVHFFDYYGNYTATLYPREELLSGDLLVRQVDHYKNPRKRSSIAREIVSAASHNILRVLKYYRSRLNGAHADTVEDACENIEGKRDELDEVNDVPKMMGIEGRIRDLYYRTWDAVLEDFQDEFTLTRRERRPPTNEINALISFGNSICYTTCLRQIYRTQLNPTISFLHEPGERRYSLALDIAEIFKPILVDRAIFRLVKNRELQPKHFEERMDGVYLKENGRKTFTKHWDERLEETIKHRNLERKVSYERLVRIECYRLVRHLCDPDEDPYEGFKMWW